eukprot:549568_1
MSQLQWPITVGEQKFEEPSMKAINKFTINNIDLLQILESSPKLFCFLEQNIHNLKSELAHFITNISEKFEPELLQLTLGRIIAPITEWQEPEEHRYVILKNFKCNNYNGSILPFHDEFNQYQFYFINIGDTIRQQKIIIYGDNPTHESDEKYLFTSTDNIEVIYNALPEDDVKDQTLGMKDMCIKYLTWISNDRLDEIIDSSADVIRIYLLRLRGKSRHGHHNKINSVQGIISPSQWDIIEENVSSIVDEDEQFDAREHIKSFKLSRHQLFAKLQINPMLLIRVFDDYGKEIKLQRSLTKCIVYDSDNNGYTKSMKNLVLKIYEKYKKKKKIPTNICAANGLRFIYNTNTKLLKLTTNSFKSSIGNIDASKKKVEISQTI